MHAINDASLSAHFYPRSFIISCFKYDLRVSIIDLISLKVLLFGHLPFRADPNCLAELHGILANNNISEALLWGEQAMELHGIRAVVLRIDIALNDDDLERAATALISEGWIELSLAVPPTNGGFWMDGFKEFMALGRRLQYPESYEDMRDMELLLLPRSYLGLGTLSSTLLHAPSGFAYPPAIALAESIATVFFKSSGLFAMLMRVWAVYFLRFEVFDQEALDELAAKNLECWLELVKLTP
ncbi:hypothetical protein J132_08440 [Termitomyces sp. J132]|nr:hypothetical protein J132_08440 [Termitomyces sp. J132]